MCTHPTEFDVACPPLPLFTLHFKTSLSRNLELSGSARLAGQQAKRISQHCGDRHNLAALLLRRWHSGLYGSVCVRVHKCIVGAFVCLPMWRLKVGIRCLPQIALHICGHLVSHSHPLMHTRVHAHTRRHKHIIFLKKNKAYQNQQCLCLLCIVITSGSHTYKPAHEF